MSTTFERPTRLPRHHHRMSERSLFRLRKREGERQLVFLPAAVLKLGLSANERRALGAEAEGSAAAMRHPFWTRLAVRTVGLGAGFVSRRFRQVHLKDFDAIAGLMEEQLEACLALPPRPMAADLPRSAVVRLLDDGDRARLAAALNDQALPRSSMHGDLHFFNFVRARDGIRIIDWEHFDPDGSFVYDYLDFDVSVGRLNLQRPWSDALARVDTSHPALRRAAGASGTAPRALLAHYLLRKIDIVMARCGGPRAMEKAKREGLLAVFRRALAALGVATWGAEGASTPFWLAACCAV